MRTQMREFWLIAGIIGLAALSLGATNDAAAAETLDNAGCLGCHSTKHKKISVRADDGKTRALAAIADDRFGKGVHGDMQCVACHKEIVDSKAQHKKTTTAKPKCATCHEAAWEEVKKQKLTEQKSRLGLV